MRYAHEVIGLMAAFPGRRFKMADLVRHVSCGRALQPSEREALRKGIRRAVHEMEAEGVVVIEPSESGNGGSDQYSWKKVVADRDANRENQPRVITPA